MKWQSGKQRRSIVDQSLRQLDLIGYKNLDSLVPSIMPYLCFLTSLRLRSRVHSDIRLDLILKACPRMEHLRVGMLGFVTDLPGPWVPESDAPQQPLALALQSLVVENACFAYSSLEDLLTACHALVELRLINVMITESVNEGTATTAALTIPTVDAPYDSNRLIRRLRDLQLQLRVFHVYIYGTTVSDADLDTMISVCPTSNKWTFWTQDLSPTIHQHLQTMPNNVTTLELYWPENGTWSQGFRLHEYLCKSTHLRHLRAPKARYLIDYMDIYRRAWDHETPKDNYGISPDVWQCRDLITLHLGFESLRDGLSGTPVKYYRILFGYISRVCPRLRDFKSDIIVGNSFGLRQSIDLSSGFCLLANLKDLRQLDIGGRESHVEECELSWMRRTGSNRKDQEARRKIVESWGDMTKLEADGHGVNWNYQAMGSMRGIITRVNDADLINGLNYNGCLLDVERMVKKIDSEGFQCWPQLQRSPILYFKK
ncbi:hypothetical protein BGX23_003295 [Mortierella sp. AD031]|nr:hypothetical protein BGX23_003295 [Mortierella sp. AD031]